MQHVKVLSDRRLANPLLMSAPVFDGHVAFAKVPKNKMKIT